MLIRAASAANQPLECFDAEVKLQVGAIPSSQKTGNIMRKMTGMIIRMRRRMKRGI